MLILVHGTRTIGVIAESVSITGSGGDPWVRWDGKSQNMQTSKKKIKSESEDPSLKIHHLHGQLPPSLFACCRVLEKLNLTRAQHLKFELPRTLGSCCPLLKQLLLAQCKGLSGAIPTSIGDCILLEDLDLCDCTSLSGSFPASLGALEHLRSVVMSGCRGVTGSLPQSMFNCKSLAILWVDGCKKLTGTLPSSFNRAMKQICIEKSKVDASGTGVRYAQLIAETCSFPILKSVRGT